MLELLPSPPDGKTGWPWTEESAKPPGFRKDGSSWPRISIITPSYNQGSFIEETIRSVLLQNYPDLEYIIIDGGSNDNSVEIIRKYEKYISFWISEPDKGQSDAINKGFRKCNGKLVNWICSDDLLARDSLNSIIFISENISDSLIIGKGLRIDNEGKVINAIAPSEIKTLMDLVDIGKFWRKKNSIMQQSCLYPLESVKTAGYLNIKRHYVMDYELWGMLLLKGARIFRYDIEVGIFRWYEQQKTSQQNAVTKELVLSAISLISLDKNMSIKEKLTLLIKVLLYYTSYLYHNLRSVIGIKRRFRAFAYGHSGAIYI